MGRTLCSGIDGWVLPMIIMPKYKKNQKVPPAFSRKALELAIRQAVWMRYGKLVKDGRIKIDSTVPSPQIETMQIGQAVTKPVPQTGTAVVGQATTIQHPQASTAIIGQSIGNRKSCPT